MGTSISSLEPWEFRFLLATLEYPRFGVPNLWNLQGPPRTTLIRNLVFHTMEREGPISRNSMDPTLSFSEDMEPLKIW
jgi:hypothetical protein